MNIVQIFYLIALLCFAASAANAPTNPWWPRTNLIGAGLFFLTLTLLVK